MNNFINTFQKKSRHHFKLFKFIYPELIKLNNNNILEFGVSEKAMSTDLFLNYSKDTGCKLFSIDNVDYSDKFKDKNWKFILSRDDNYNFVKKNIPNYFSLILLDTLHEAKHVQKIIYNYFDMLELNCCFFIDDISWIPYLKESDKNRFYGEINNLETFNLLLEIYYNNRDNIDIEFSFQGTGMCKITKIKDVALNNPRKIQTRQNTIKNLIRKIIR